MEITIAKSAGFCFGVRRAVKMAEDLAADGGGYTLGPLIHNRHELDRLSAMGVRAVKSAEELPEGARVLIRAHGVPEAVYDALRARGAEIRDATCPFVARIHGIVNAECEAGRQVVVMGDAAHPEVQGICGHCRDAVVFGSREELENWVLDPENREKSLSVVAQTTAHKENWERNVKFIKKQYTNAKIFDTICSATDVRQTEASQLAAESDAMLVLGDPMSSNTQKLAQIARERCGLVLCAENADGLDFSVLGRVRRLGITAGASTPEWIMKEVVNKMSEELKNIPEETMTEESFEELLEQSIKTLNTGDKVTGIVTRVTGGEVYVDLGVKQAAYVPVSEMSDDPAYKVEENVKVGDEIAAFVVRVNDVEGMIMLSKKKLDSIKGWDTVADAVESKETMEGVVTEDNKGGIVVMVKGVRVFVPASQTGLPKDADMTTLLKQTVKLRITEVNRARRRVVGSIRAVTADERRAKAEAIWNTIEIGNEYDGVVKSLTTYGAFVDIGGVDGMVHISELSWGRVRHPSEIVKVGDAVKVFVIGVDKEKKKISLGYRRAEDNPWTKFISQFQIGETASVKVLKFMPFGAFAEVIPGVDGLIHISQISTTHVKKPDDVLTEGEVVDAKIVDIDMDRQKVSLSIRALLEGDEADAE
ncbi:MAG: bifunctional 4-hydroxy-3-methylbut-2-enyl diphosphate reductase/30S ribosomal protein S1 [Clostridia bacterium]|nr:bifunctional 4-hydroxy-3-methylbut-2-enyl diphosphate reductase/30S ribosomal protein S1 [Clostridia bacterium]